jgi:hypothetical protein
VSKPVAVVAFLLAQAVPLAGQATKSYSIAGNDVAIYDLAGEVTVREGGGGAVTVEVTVSGRDGSRLTVEAGEIRGRETLRVMYPSDDIVYPQLGHRSRTDLHIRDDGTWGGSDDSWKHDHEGRRITIRGDGSGLEASANLLVTIPAGRKVGIYLGVGRMEVTNVDGQLRLDAASADVTARRTRGNLNIDTGSGNVHAENLEGAVSLDTGSGDVSIAGLKNGSLEIDTGSGSVTGSQLETRDAKIDTGSGDIRLDGIGAPHLELETGSGTIHADLTAKLEVLSVETGSGDVTIRLPDGTGAAVDLETGSGDFTLELPVQLIKKGEGSLRGQIGDGHGRIHIETGSGDIALVK